MNPNLKNVGTITLLRVCSAAEGNDPTQVAHAHTMFKTWGVSQDQALKALQERERGRR